MVRLPERMAPDAPLEVCCLIACLELGFLEREEVALMLLEKTEALYSWALHQMKPYYCPLDLAEEHLLPPFVGSQPELAAALAALVVPAEDLSVTSVLRVESQIAPAAVASRVVEMEGLAKGCLLQQPKAMAAAELHFEQHLEGMQKPVALLAQKDLLEGVQPAERISIRWMGATLHLLRTPAQLP